MDPAGGALRCAASRTWSAYADFAAQSQHCAVGSLALAAATCGLFAVLSSLIKSRPGALYGIVFLGVAEMFWFAHTARPTFDSRSVINGDLKSFLDQHPGDYR